MMEVCTHGDYSWFVTLTYAPEALPITLDSDGAPVATLAKKAFRRWVDNQQQDLGYFGYYAVGEYGDLSGRPHYHMAVFPQHAGQVNALCDNWRRRFGFAQVAEMCDERARYLSGYTCKKLTAANDDRLRGNQEPEFRVSSRRPPLGAAFAEAVAQHYKTNSAAKKVLEERGDVDRTWRTGGRIYPIGQWPLKRIRELLGIPLLHRDRAQHPGYLDWHELQEALCEPEKGDNQDAQIKAKRWQKLHRAETVSI